MQSWQKIIQFGNTNLNSNSVQIRTNDRADNENCDFKGTKHQSKMPDFQTFADSFSGKEWSLKYEMNEWMKSNYFSVVYESSTALKKLVLDPLNVLYLALKQNFSSGPPWFQAHCLHRSNLEFHEIVHGYFLWLWSLKTELEVQDRCLYYRGRMNQNILKGF